MNFRPHLQGLEDRCLLTTVTNLMDSGPGSLRQAIIDAPAGGTVDFQDGLSGTITLTSAPLTINKILMIDGPGASVITVSGNHAREVFNIPSPYTVSISGLTITNGNSGQGGGIFNGGNLTLSGCSVSGNSTRGTNGGGQGGGIYNSGTVTLSHSTVAGNAGDSGFNGDGRAGGIYNTGTLNVTSSSLISGNTAYAAYNIGGPGGGIYNTGTLNVTNSTVSGNSAGGGGGNGGGGGIVNTGAVMVTNSTLSSNTAPGNGGGILNNTGTVTVTNSTLSGNSAGGNGGGIYNSSNSNVTIQRSTFNLNAAATGAGISHTGTGMLTLTNSTLSGNFASSQGGGIFHSGSGMLKIDNTIVAQNNAPTSSVDVMGALNSQGYNLIGNGTGGSGYSDTDLVGTAAMPIDPLLGLLDNYGGPTKTMAVLPRSPALNAGDPGALGSFDQRGVVRSGGVNIGAYQASATAFVVSAPAKVNPGVPFDVAVAAVDPFGQPACGYVGTITFSTTDPDPGVVLPADYTFTLDDGGAHTFSDTGLGETTLLTHGHRTITVTDTADGSIMGSVTVKVRGTHLVDSSDSSISARQAVVAGDRFFASLVAEDFGLLVVRSKHQGFGGIEPLE